MSNVQGSAAGAGSGTFHTYANGRRREAERIEMMEREARERAAKEEMEVSLFERRERERERENSSGRGSSNVGKQEKKKKKKKLTLSPFHNRDKQTRLSALQRAEEEKTAKRRAKRQKLKVCNGFGTATLVFGKKVKEGCWFKGLDPTRMTFLLLQKQALTKLPPP